MTYDLYFHDDFDGRASAAVICDFLEKTGTGRIAAFVPVSYPIPHGWLTPEFFEKPNALGGAGNPAIVVDYRYSPQAIFWFDHHPTTFATPELRKYFYQTRRHNWDASYASCCHQILDHLSRHFDYRPSAAMRELARWLDVIDGANYRSPRQTVFPRDPAIKIDRYIDACGTTKQAKLTWLIRALGRMPLAQIADDSRIASFTKRMAPLIDRSLLFYRRHLSRPHAQIGFIDLTGLTTVELRYGAYFIHPSLMYMVAIKNRPGKMGFHISVGVNPWKRARLSFHIGKLMSRFGGGGHARVGACEVSGYERAKKIAADIIDFIATHEQSR